MATVLQITPHPVFPPRGGRRAFFFLREMARVHDVVAIFPQRIASLEGTRDGYVFPLGVRVMSPSENPPPRTVFDRLPKRIGPGLHYRWLRRSWRGPACSVLLDTYHLIGKALRENKIDVVIFDHHFTVPMASVVRRLSPGSVLTLNAHNIDSELCAQLLKSARSPAERAARLKEYRLTLWNETHLKRFVDAFWACSEIDRQKLEAMNQGLVPGYAVGNGIATELLPFDGAPAKANSKKLLFCGSLNYPPNRNGLEWFRKEIWPALRQHDPRIRLVVVGLGALPGDFAELRSDPRVDFVGEVDNVVASYHQTAVSVVPLLEGSGTRVKILEAMGLGNPVVSTTVGAEGIEAKDGEQILLADTPEAFGAAVLRLLSDETLFEKLRQTGRKLVETKYDWKLLGQQINRIITELAERAPG